MKIPKVENIGTATGAGSTVAKGDDFLSRLNTTMNNFKQLMEMANKMRGGAPGNSPDTRQGDVTNLPKVSGGNWQQLLNALVNSKYGDMPIGDIIQELSPYTLKQLRGFAQNAAKSKQ